MDTTPFISHGSDSSVKAVKASRFTCLSKALQRWLRISLSEAYLSSNASRRTAWRWSCPLCAVLVVCSNVCFQAGPSSLYWLPLHLEDALFAALMLGASRLNTTTLLPDAAIVFTAVMYFALNAYTKTADDYHHFLDGIRKTPVLIMFFGVVGVHSTCLGLLAVICCALIIGDPSASRDDVVTIPCVTVAAWACATIYEVSITSLHSHSVKQSRAKERLLDKATNGYCEIDTASGVILKASPQMATTFGRVEIIGSCLEDMVDKGDIDKVVSLYTRLEVEESNLSPILVTCNHRTGESSFDALLCPYAISHDRLSVFVRVFGEIRGTPAMDLVAQHSIDSPACPSAKALDKQSMSDQVGDLRSSTISADLRSSNTSGDLRTSNTSTLSDSILRKTSDEEVMGKTVSLIGIEVAGAEAGEVLPDGEQSQGQQEKFFAERQARYNERKERKRAQRNKVVNAVWGGSSYGDMVRREMEKQANRIGRNKFRSNNSDSSCCSSRASSCSRASSVSGVSVPMIAAEPAHAVSCRSRDVEPEPEREKHQRRSWAHSEEAVTEEHEEIRRTWS